MINIVANTLTLQYYSTGMPQVTPRFVSTRVKWIFFMKKYLFFALSQILLAHWACDVRIKPFIDTSLVELMAT